MQKNKDFNIEITEKHHKYKLDSPSGTAIDLRKKIQTKDVKIKSDRKEKNQIGFHEIT